MQHYAKLCRIMHTHAKIRRNYTKITLSPPNAPANSYSGLGQALWVASTFLSGCQPVQFSPPP